MENDEEKSIILSEITNEDIKNLIYTIRDKQVMLDSDVAMLYHYETKKINQSVKRNMERFPENFCFQLTEKEMQEIKQKNITLNQSRNMRSHFGTASKK